MTFAQHRDRSIRRVKSAGALWARTSPWKRELEVVLGPTLCPAPNSLCRILANLIPSLWERMNPSLHFFFFLSIGPPKQIKYDTECQEIAQMIIKVLQENHFSTHNASDTKGVGSFLTATTGFPPLHTSWVPYCSVQSAAIHLSRSRAQSDASHRSRLSSVCLTNRL